MTPDPPITIDNGNGYHNGFSDGKKNENNLSNPNFIEPDNANGATIGADKPPPIPDSSTEIQDDVPPVSFFKLFKYATTNDRIMMTVGILSAVITGLCTPANTFLFGRLTDAMIQKGMNMGQNSTEAPDSASWMNDSNSTISPFQGSPADEVDMQPFYEWFIEQVTFFAIFNSLIGLVMLVSSYISIMLFNYAAHNQVFTIRSAFLKSALNQDIGWYDLNQSGEFASRMNEDLIKLSEGLGEKVVMYVHYIVAFLSSITLAFVLGWQLALVCLASLPVTMISVGIVAIITSKLAKREMQEYAKAGSIAEEVFSAIRTVFAFGGQDKETERYKKNLVNARKINIKKGFFSGFGFGLLWFFIYASYALAFWYGVGLVVDQRRWDPKDIIYTPGIMFTVFFSVMMASMNLGISSPFIEVFGVAKGAGAKIFQTIERVPEINTLSQDGDRPLRVEGSITFRNVHFTYPSRKDVKVLQGINLKVERGQTVALVGSSGCGKSTCIQLIQRFYDPVEGDILLDDQNIRELNISWLRSRIGVVGQEPVLFNTTVFENIRYGNENATHDEIISAAQAANAHNFIKKLPNGYETLVGERGAQMSGGQKQRIAIARALVRNPEILLLDEATSALDTASEAKVQAALEKASEGRTTIIVAHRLSTIRNADRIFVFSGGKIMEEGNHKELMALQKHYYDLVTTQIGTAEEEAEEHAASHKMMEIVDEDDTEFTDNMAGSDEDETSGTHEISVWKVMQWNKTEWPYITAGSVSSVLMGAAMPLFALIFGEIIGVMTSDDDDFVRAEANQYSLYFVITGIVVGIATFLQIYTYGIAGEILTERLRGRTFQTMLRQEIGWFDDKTNGTGTLCAKLSGDAAAVQGATGQRIGTVLQSISTLVLSIGLSMFYEWRLAFLALAFFPFILFASYFEIKIMEHENQFNSKAMERSTKLAVEVVSNIRTVVSLGREQMFHQKYVQFLLPALAVSKRSSHIRGLVYGIARSLMFFAFAACMALGGHLVVTDGVQIQDVFVVTQALIMGSVSIANALAFAPNFQKGLIAAGKINHLFQRQPKVQDPVPVDASNSKWEAYGGVIYYKTEFFYPSRSSQLVLRGLNMNVMQGQTVALVGSSGCGKSTCIQLLERFYDSTNGYVAIDHHDVTSVTMKSLRSQMGIVSQEPSLFDRTIAENIAYGDNSREVSHDEIIKSAKMANIHNFIVSLPLGYDTKMGDKGTQLSGGQKQRVAIARALIRNPRILLLDEATSALDTESEKVVQDALDAAKEGRTCITIAHRLSTIVDADVIFVIDGGRVVEQGTHKELLQLRGIYHGLYRLQAGNR